MPAITNSSDVEQTVDVTALRDFSKNNLFFTAF